MAELSDEMLMAHADDELDFSERARVEAVLSTDPRSRASLRMFKATGRSLADHFPKPMNEPVPQRLIDLVVGGSAKTPAAASTLAIGGRSRFSAILAHIISAGQPHWPAALAYTTALLIAAATGWYLHEATTRTPVASEVIFIDNGRVLAQGALWRTLETAASGVQVAATGREQVASVQARLTFKSRQHGFCRQYELTLRNGGHFAGIGCRGDDASWQVQIHAPTMASARSGRIVAADGDESGLAALVGYMIDGDALGAADEATLIGNQWRP